MPLFSYILLNYINSKYIKQKFRMVLHLKIEGHHVRSHLYIGPLHDLGPNQYGMYQISRQADIQ